MIAGRARQRTWGEILDALERVAEGGGHYCLDCGRARLSGEAAGRLPTLSWRHADGTGWDLTAASLEALRLQVSEALWISACEVLDDAPAPAAAVRNIGPDSDPGTEELLRQLASYGPDPAAQASWPVDEVCR